MDLSLKINFINVLYILINSKINSDHSHLDGFNIEQKGTNFPVEIITK